MIITRMGKTIRKRINWKPWIRSKQRTMWGHNPEEGHHCPRCDTRYPCTIENGHCDNNGLCNNCIRDKLSGKTDEEFEYFLERY